MEWREKGTTLEVLREGFHGKGNEESWERRDERGRRKMREILLMDG